MKYILVCSFAMLVGFVFFRFAGAGFMFVAVTIVAVLIASASAVSGTSTNVRVCGFCNVEVRYGETHCDECGRNYVVMKGASSVAQMQTCPHCVSEIPASATVCRVCTRDVGRESMRH